MMIDVVLPCLDEAEALPWVLSRMPAGFRAIVADNGSSDGSPDVAAALGAQVVAARPRGFGAAVHAGLLAATADVVCFLDADGSLDPADLPTVAEPVQLGWADLVLGRGRPPPRAAGRWPARAGTAALPGRLRRRAGVPLHALGRRGAARRSDLLALDITDRRFGYP